MLVCHSRLLLLKRDIAVGDWKPLTTSSNSPTSSLTVHGLSTLQPCVCTHIKCTPTTHTRWYSGLENLFNLTADPYEQNDLADEAGYSTIRKGWRNKLKDMFADEGRDETWVKGGELQKQQICWRFDYLPNYPCYVDEINTFACSTE